MWKEPPYFREILDPETPGVDRYIALVSSPDSGKDTEVHHIVPVAYFKDVLARTDCRMAGSPDMNPVNLVPLSKGRHVLAHFYLAKYAKKCIAVQMRNAFCQTYQTTDFSKVTEEEVLSRIDEINAEYSRLKTAKKEHKDGVDIRRTKTCVSLNNWKDGKKVGVSMQWAPDGTVKKVHDHEQGILVDKVKVKFVNPAPNGIKVSAENTDGIKFVDIEIVQSTPEASMLCVRGNRMEIMVGSQHPDRGYSLSITYGTSTRWYEGDNTWKKAGEFLSRDFRHVLVRGIRSVKMYASLMGMELNENFKHMLFMLENCIPEVEPLPIPEIPSFESVNPPKKSKTDFDRVSPAYRKLTQVRDGKPVATYWWDERGKITGICQDGLPNIFYEKRHIQLNGWHDGAISNEFHDIRLEVPEPWFHMSDEERLDFIKSRYPVFNSLNPIPPIPERILATLAKAA